MPPEPNDQAGLRGIPEIRAIRPGMDVLDPDGERIGTVLRVDPGGDSQSGGGLEVGTGFLGRGYRLSLPVTLIRSVSRGCVFLSEPRSVIEQRGWRHGWYRTAAPATDADSS